MTDGTALDSVALDALLRDRSQYQGWLARLDENASRVPEAVTARVRQDYESRLSRVLDQLKAHAGAVGEALARLRTALGDAETRDAEAGERLAEAEIRHLVGEYDDDAWGKLKADVDGERRALHADMEQTRQEIARLADVQAIILEVPASASDAGSPVVMPEPAALESKAPSEPTATPAEPAATGLGSHDAPAASAASVETPPIFAPAAPKALDELDFLKSVTDEAVDPPAAQKIAAVAPAAAKGKSVRCRECGHDNRPSDWYCDRCGAEISDL